MKRGRKALLLLTMGPEAKRQEKKNRIILKERGGEGGKDKTLLLFRPWTTREGEREKKRKRGLRHFSITSTEGERSKEKGIAASSKRARGGEKGRSWAHFSFFIFAGGEGKGKGGSLLNPPPKERFQGDVMEEKGGKKRRMGFITSV